MAPETAPVTLGFGAFVPNTAPVTLGIWRVALHVVIEAPASPNVCTGMHGPSTPQSS